MVEDEQAVSEVRAYLNTVKGFKSVSIHCRAENFGLATSIISGVTEVLSDYKTIIVLEDDMVTSSVFLRYMNNALLKFANDEDVISIHGYMFPVDTSDLPEAFFLRGADCWGWATWSHGWDQFNPDGQMLLDELCARGLEKDFDYANSYPYLDMLKDQIKGLNDSWAIRWYASAFLANKLTLYPGCSLVHNIGNDGSGVHSKDSRQMDVNLRTEPIKLDNIPLNENTKAKLAIIRFYHRQAPSWWIRILKKLFKMWAS